MLGIVGLVCCSPGLVVSLIAIVLGRKGVTLAESGQATNKGIAQAGFILGIIGLVLGIGWWIFTIASGGWKVNVNSG